MWREWEWPDIAILTVNALRAVEDYLQGFSLPRSGVFHSLPASKPVPEDPHLLVLMSPPTLD